MARRQEFLKVRDVFYILTNGECSEMNYFELIKSRKSIYDVKVKYLNADPVGLVKFAIGLAKDVNQVWCVFDIDNTFNDNRLISAINLAKSEHNIPLAFSNTAFEVWLLSHFHKITKPLNNNELIEEMNSLLKNELNLHCKYNKGDENLIKKYFIPQIDKALLNTKVGYQKFVKEHYEQYPQNDNYQIWEWNPCSNIFMLIEALKLQKR